MKKLLITALCVLFSTAAFSQNTFNKGDMVVNAGIGFGNTLHTGSYLETAIPPVSASFEYGIVDNLFDDKSSIGVGGYLGYTSQKWKGTNLKYSDIIIGARGSFHYQFVDKLDTYGGLMLGYDVVSTSGDWAGYSASSSSLTAGGYLGARYYFTPNFAVNSELGYNISIFSVGISYKF